MDPHKQLLSDNTSIISPDASFTSAATALSSKGLGGRYRTSSSDDSTMLTLDAAIAMPASIGAKAK